MIRFLLKRTQKLRPELPTSENYETIDCDVPELERRLASGGFDLARGLCDVYSIVAATPVQEDGDGAVVVHRRTH